VCVVGVLPVVSRDQPTPVSYLVLKTEVDSKGQLSSRLESSLFSRIRVIMMIVVVVVEMMIMIAIMMNTASTK